MMVEVLGSAGAAARRAAAIIAQVARAAVDARGRAVLALSGGTTPTPMLEQLATEAVPWSRVHLFQVDERIVPAPDPARNLSRLRAHLLTRIQVPTDQVHPMPVEDRDLAAAAARYAATLRRVAGTPPVLDLIHLGLGADGHTASLVPGDPALLEMAREVTVTGPYRGLRRMTLTLPVLSRGREVLWLVTGAGKAWAVQRLRQGDHGIPAGRVPGTHALLLMDAAAGH